MLVDARLHPERSGGIAMGLIAIVFIKNNISVTYARGLV